MLTKISQMYVDLEHGMVVPKEITPEVGDKFGPWVVVKVGVGPLFGIVYGGDCFPTGTQFAAYGDVNQTFEIEESGYFKPIRLETE